MVKSLIQLLQTLEAINVNLKELIKKLANNQLQDFTFEQYLQDFIPNVLLKSDTLQQAYGIKDIEMEEMYRQAYELYQQDCFSDAVIIYQWLVILNPFVNKYWLGLAANRQMLKDYENALKAYAIILLIDDIDPYPHYYAYECYTAMGEPDEAHKALKLADERAALHTIYQPLRKQIRNLLNN